MHPIPYTAKQYAILGRLVANRRPDVAEEMFTVFHQAAKAPVSDYTLIGTFYSRFCLLHNILPDDFRGPLYKSQKVEMRRLFIACMVRLYCPHIHVLEGFRPYGLLTQLAVELAWRKSRISDMIKELIVMEKVYQEFREKVDFITQQLTQPYETRTD